MTTFEEFQASRTGTGDVFADASAERPSKRCIGDAGYLYLGRFGISEWYPEDGSDDQPLFVPAHGPDTPFTKLEDAERRLYDRLMTAGRI